MGSRIWPAPGSTEVSGSQLAAAPETTTCPHCELDECECDHCDVCGLKCDDCACPSEVYVVYATTIRVAVDYDGDVISVRVNDELSDPQSVENEDGDEIDFNGALARRAREAAQNQDWPSWDIG